MVSKSIENTLFGFAFNVTYESNVSTLFLILIWLIEKLIALSYAVIVFFSNTPWNGISSVFLYFRVPYPFIF